MMVKLDLKKESKQYYNPSTQQVEIVDIPKMAFMMIDGEGDPNTARSYQDALQALYSVSYALKFMLKKSGDFPDFTVMPLEGLWWADNMDDFLQENKSNWKWTMMIRQPDFVTEEHVIRGIEQVREKKGIQSIDLLRFESYHEGLSVQIMHIGPYSEEGPTIQKMHEFAFANGYRLQGKHHEIYLSDPRRISPEKWKTVIRQPVQK
jgi:hypothetical protein